jgi:uncharacterized integral membrane protein
MEDQNYQTYAEPRATDSTPLFTEQPKKKKNTWWIILLVLLLVLCCCIVIGVAVVIVMLASGQYRIDWSILTPILSFI